MGTDGLGDLAFDVPAGWTVGDDPPPTPSGGIRVERWTAWGAPDGTGRVVIGCLGGDLATWSDEAAPLVLEWLASLAGRVAGRLDPALRFGAARGDRVARGWGESFQAAGSPSGETVARTVLGFTRDAGGTRLHGCVLVCAPADRACTDAATRATATGFAPPPAPDAVATVVVSGVHHPRVVAAGTVALLIALAAAAVVTRPRPWRK